MAVVKQVKIQGKGLHRPRNRSKITAEVEFRINDEFGECIIKKEAHEFTLEEADEEIWHNIESYIMSMQTGEESVFCVMEPRSTWCQIKLISFEEAAEIWKLDQKTKVGIALHHKQRGNDLFHIGNIKAAASRYCRAVKYIISTGVVDVTVDNIDKPITLQELQLQCLSNLTLCHLKLNHYSHALQTASKVLEIDTNNSKALYRRGVANLELDSLDEAIKDLTRAKELDPNNKVIIDQLQIVRQRKNTNDVPLRDAMKQMFNRK